MTIVNLTRKAALSLAEQLSEYASLTDAIDRPVFERFEIGVQGDQENPSNKASVYPIAARLQIEAEVDSE